MFRQLELSMPLLESVRSLGYERPTPIQEQSIPLILEGRDVVGCAQTGTGKTAAFMLPTLQRIGKGGGIKALVVTPTRELAVQIEEVARASAVHTGHKVLAVYGGVGYGPQKSALKKGIDVLVATPGRLLDLQGTGDVYLGKVEVLVLDEADRMLDMGFWPDVRRILSKLPARRQNLLFSATMSPGVLRVIDSTLNDPIQVEVGPKAVPVDTVEQAVYPVNGMQKAQLLVHLLKQDDLERVLVFTRTKHRAERLAKVLRRSGIQAASIHSDRSQGQRQQALDGFKKGRHSVLVATDIVARGIDVDNISHVVNYDLPNTPEEYVHRIGRTARAGNSGNAISFLAAEETPGLRDIEGHLGSTLRCEDVDGFQYADRVVPDENRSAKKMSRTVFNGGAMSRRRPRRRIKRGI